MVTKKLIEALGDLAGRLDVLEDWLRQCIEEAGKPGDDADEVECVAAYLNVLMLKWARDDLNYAIGRIERVIEWSKQ